MTNKSLLGAGFALLSLSVGATASSVPTGSVSAFDVGSYVFQLDGGGGGAQATLNGVPVNIYCDDFDNNLALGTDTTAYVTGLSTTANLSDTRFGNLPSADFNVPTLMTGNHTTSTDTADETFLQSASALTRYELAAYLVSQYNTKGGDSTQNNEIQEAIWQVLDPTVEGAPFNPDSLTPSSYTPEIEQAIAWYQGIQSNTAALNGFLSQFDIVSPNYPNMQIDGAGLGLGGFQEQIVYAPTPTPEPRNAAAGLALVLAAAMAWRRKHGAKQRTCQQSFC